MAGPSLNTILSAGYSSFNRDLSPLQAASRVPDDVGKDFDEIGFSRASTAELYQTLAQKGVNSDDITASCRRFLSQRRQVAPTALSDSFIEELQKEKQKASPQLEKPLGDFDREASVLRAELTSARNQIEEQSKKLQEYQKQLQEVENQVLGGFSFETWKRVQQMSAEQQKAVECSVCLDADATVVSSCGCKCLCANCYRVLPLKANGLKQCPQCAKPIR